MHRKYKQSIIFLPVEFNENLAAIHGYLCGDGYVITNPPSQNKKYYYIGFRNTNQTLLEDFQKRFFDVYGVKPIITNEGRCKIQNKQIYYVLTKDYSYYSYEWRLPRLSTLHLKFWLRAFFDCEGWVECQSGKSRFIGLECCNESGIYAVERALKGFSIHSRITKKKGRIIWRLTICGLENIKNYQKAIGFLHPDKNKKLQEAIDSYKNYHWVIPSNELALFDFIANQGKIRDSHNQIRFNSIMLENLQNLKKALNKLGIESKIAGPWKNNRGSVYYCLSCKASEVNAHGKNCGSSARAQEDK